MSKRKYSDDDGHVIADMSGIGHHPLFTMNLNGFKPKEAGQKARQSLPIERELSVWQMTWLALRLVLPIVFSFLGIIALFLLFCQFVWFR